MNDRDNHEQALHQVTESLREHPFAKGLDSDIVDLIAACARHTVHPEGEYLIREGMEAHDFHLVRHGTVSLEMSVPGRGKLGFLTLGAGDMLGVNWLVPPYRWSYDARATTLVRSIAINAQCLRSACDADPRVGYTLMKSLLVPIVERLQLARLQCAQLFDEQRFVSEKREHDNA